MEPYQEDSFEQKDLIKEVRSKTWSELKNSPIHALRLTPDSYHYLRRAGFRYIGELFLPDPTQRTRLLHIPAKNRREIAGQARKAINRWQQHVEHEARQAVQVPLLPTPNSRIGEISADDIYAALFPTHENPVQLIRIEALGLSSRTYNALLRAKITTIGQVKDFSKGYKKIPGIGTNSAKEIRQILSDYLSSPTARILTEQPLADLATITRLANTPLRELQLTHWLYTLFTGGYITTVGQLVALTNTQLSQFGKARHLTEQRLIEVKSLLDVYLQQLGQVSGQGSDISLAFEVDQKTGGEIPVPLSSSSRLQQQEAQLQQDLRSVRFIGELSVNEGQFRDLCQLVRTTALSRVHVPQPHDVPAALFVSLMVFTARFAQVESRNFWTPYAEMVWGLPEADPGFQDECRQRFVTAARELEQSFPDLLPFRQDSAGDVVRPVYRHAILPAYLQEDFAHWLQKEWPNILDIPADSLTRALREDRRLVNQPRPLAEFLQSEQTTETAVALIIQLAEGMRQLQNGQSLAVVGTQWLPHTIQHTLWQAISSDYPYTAPTIASARLGRGRLEWVWDFQENEMNLRLRNLTLTARPEKVIWDEEDLELFLNPWQLEGGYWWLDELLLERPQTAKGTLVVIGETGDELTRLDVPLLTEQPVLLFQVQDEETAVQQSGISKSGWYCLSSRSEITLDGEVSKHKTVVLPQLLKNEANHQQADIYHLQLPVIAWEGSELLAEWVTDEAEEETVPHLEGPLLAGTSPRMPSVYQDITLRLIIPNPIPGATLWLKYGDEVSQIPLPDSESEQIIDLQSHLLPMPATYSLQLRQGLHPVLKEPLTFTVLPGVRISPPSPDHLYSYTLKPNCMLHDLTADNVVKDSRYQFKLLSNNRILLEWLDWRDEDVRLQLQFEDRRVQLGWPLPQRIFSWLEPTPRNGFVRESDLAHTTIHIIAPNERKFPKARTYKYVDVWIVGAEADSRRINFRKHRHLSRVIIRSGDPLHEMIYDYIRRYPGQPVNVKARLYKDEWTILEVRPQPQISGSAIHYNADQQVIKLSCDIPSSWEGDIQFTLYDLHHPFAPPEIWQRAQLEKEQTLPFTLPTTNYDYVLTIECDGQRLPVLSRLNQGTKATYQTADIATLLDLLQGRQQGAVPKECSADFIRLMVSQTSAGASFIPTRKQLYQFATIPNLGNSTPPEDLDRVWQGFRRLQLVHDVDTWRDQYGFLPSWAVLDHPVKLQLQRHPKVVLRVFPEKVFQKGNFGVGYAYLKLEGDHKEKVYVSWRPYYDPYVRIKVGRSASDNLLFSEMDTQELRIIRQCSQCGRFITIETPAVRKEHFTCLHYYNATFKSVTQNDDLVATLRKEDTNLQHVYSPSYYQDQQVTALLWQQEEIPSVPESDDPIAHTAYQYATVRWLQRYREGNRGSYLFEQIINYRRRSLEQLSDRLDEFKVPAFQAAARLLESFGTVDSPWQLDRSVFLLALLLRTQAYNPDLLPSILQEFGLKISNLEELLAMGDEFCPELLLWALTWVELFFVHAIA